MYFSDLKYEKRQEKAGHLKELLDAGLVLNSTLLVLDGEYFIVGINDVYALSRSKEHEDEQKWWIMGIFRRQNLFDRLPDGVGTSTISRVYDDSEEWFYAQLTVKSQEALNRLVEEITWPSDPLKPKKLEIKLFVKEKKNLRKE